MYVSCTKIATIALSHTYINPRPTILLRSRRKLGYMIFRVI